MFSLMTMTMIMVKMMMITMTALGGKHSIVGPQWWHNLRSDLLCEDAVMPIMVIIFMSRISIGVKASLSLAQSTYSCTKFLDSDDDGEGKLTGQTVNWWLATGMAEQYKPWSKSWSIWVKIHGQIVFQRWQLILRPLVQRVTEMFK